MTSISVKTKLTLRVPDQDFGSFSQEVGFFGIDVDEDVEAQVKKCADAVPLVSEEVVTQLAQTAVNASGLAMEGAGLGPQFTEFKDKMTRVVNRIVDVVKDLKEKGETVNWEKLSQQFGVVVEEGKDGGE